VEKLATAVVIEVVEGQVTLQILIIPQLDATMEELFDCIGVVLIVRDSVHSVYLEYVSHFVGKGKGELEAQSRENRAFSEGEELSFDLSPQ
jgi:hypothetical protein